jgi:hypothetical protein
VPEPGQKTGGVQQEDGGSAAVVGQIRDFGISDVLPENPRFSG